MTGPFRRLEQDKTDMPNYDAEIAIVGAGIAGIATAYYLSLQNPRCSPVIVDFQQPMSFTSAHSGDIRRTSMSLRRWNA